MSAWLFGGKRPAVALAGLVAAVVLALPCAAQDEKTWKPRPTIADDLARTKVGLVDGYVGRHPRLLFDAADREALKAKAAVCPALWDQVLRSSTRLGDAAPDSKEIRSGAHYWRIEGVQSGALAWLVTGDKVHAERAIRWMVAYCKEDVWGDGDWRPNVDLQASWYLYHISIAYDILYDELSEADRKVIRDGLAAHAKAIYEDFDLKNKEIRFDQNHTYIPMVGMTTAALVLLGDVPEAKDWLKLGYAVMRRCRYALGPDGYYYEGTGYWAYALHWHVRYADLISRATGEPALDLPILHENWRFPLYLTLPDEPNMFDVGDIGRWTGTDRGSTGLNNCGVFWGIASKLKSPESRLVGDLMSARWPERDYPAAAFLWFDPSIQPASLDAIKPYHHFADHDFVSWRSSWDKDATCVLLRMGPPQGHAAVAKRKEMTDWTPNSGHTHADIGAFWLYAKGTALAFGTGYTAEKWTRDQNTLLVDNTGQGMDGSYWVDRGFSWDRLDKVRLDRVHLADDYAFASGEMGPAYPAKLDPLSLRRTLVATKEWVLLVDDLNAGAPRRLTWICHSDGEFKADGPGVTAKVRGAALHVLPLSAVATECKMDKTTVVAGTSPGKGTPTHRGFEVTYTMKTPAKRARLVTLLVPLGGDEKPPTVVTDGADAKAGTVALKITWADGRTESVAVNLTGDEGAAPVVRQK
ncbi:MAG: DUF4962 domain-containing protein [Planctomycetes bacterium]|nr:DUF4962 domain-containing protein [Planctomycetota bacterium]